MESGIDAYIKKPAVPLKSRWHKWLEIEAFGLEQCELACNGTSWAISYLLDKSGINHECMAGYVERAAYNELLVPHYWIDLGEGWIMDLCLRMWMGNMDGIPHGVFHMNEAVRQGIKYHGEIEIRGGYEYSEPFLNCLTDGVIHQVEFSRPEEV